MTTSHTIRFAAAAATLLVARPSTSVAQRPNASDSLVVSTTWLAARLNDPRVVVLEVTHGDARGARIPGARTISYADIVVHRDGLRTELPPVAALQEAFERAGVGDSTRVVVYAHEAPMATRALFTLAYLGHDRFSLLDGGIARWRAEGRPVARSAPQVARGRLSPRPRPELIADADWIMSRLGRPGISLIDTRTDGEYVGTGNRSGMPSGGHLAGARQLQWEELFRDPRTSLLRDRAELARLFAERANAGDEVVTYCWVGYRASATWFVARYLGYDARMYDGSYQDWSQRNLPVKAGTSP